MGRDLVSATVLALGCLTVHGFAPDMRAPGVALHIAAFIAYVFGDVQTSPVVSLGLWAGGRNQMTRIQVMLRVLTQLAGNALAFLLFGLFWSFRPPGEGPYKTFLSLESIAGMTLTFGASFLAIKKRDAKDKERLQKTQ